MRSQLDLVGLGRHGHGVWPTSLRRAGYNVHVCDVRAGVAAAFAANGGIACAERPRLERLRRRRLRGRQCGADRGVLFGVAATAPAMRPGSVFVMCSTVDPTSRSNSSVASRSWAPHVDAPISGGAAKAAAGEMTLMTAGPPGGPYAQAEPFLEAMAAKVYRLGEQAGGSKVKIINQLLAGVHIAAAAEAMALGLRRASTRRRSTRSSPTAPATAGCSRTGWRTCSRRLHAALGGRHLRQGPRPRARYGAGHQVSAAAREHGSPDVHAGVQRRLRARGRCGGDQDLSRHRPASGSLK